MSLGADTGPVHEVDGTVTEVMVCRKGEMGAETEVSIVALAVVSITHDTRKLY